MLFNALWTSLAHTMIHSIMTIRLRFVAQRITFRFRNADTPTPDERSFFAFEIRSITIDSI